MTVILIHERVWASERQHYARLIKQPFVVAYVAAVTLSYGQDRPVPPIFVFDPVAAATIKQLSDEEAHS